MSLKSAMWRYLGLLAIAALAVGVFAGPASAKKLSASQRASIAKQLRAQVKKNPAILHRKSFIKRASLVNFKLPVTIALRESNTLTNPNSATVDLGTSLGKRTVNLGGKLRADIVFHDSYDGGALGNVDIDIKADPNYALTSTSIPILWNDQVTQAGTSWDNTLLYAGGFPQSSLSSLGHAAGCNDVQVGATHLGQPELSSLGKLKFGVGAMDGAGNPSPGGTGLPGVPIHSTSATGPVVGFAAAQVDPAYTGGLDNTINAIKGTGQLTGTVLDNNNVGANTNPFPGVAANGTPAPNQASDVRNTVLRTNALSLTVAPAGTTVINQQNNSTGVAGSQNEVMGASGGQANLFGNIPGKGYGIDVTVNLQTRINSIIRIMDQDAFEPLVSGANWPAAVFSCSQIWTGGIQNYIPAVRLAGNLKIAPAITAGGHLRIAKATVASLPGYNARFAVAACLVPNQAYNQEIAGQSTVPSTATILANTDTDGAINPSIGPANVNAIAAPPAANCSDPASPFVANSALPPATVDTLAGSDTVDGAFAVGTGNSASVAADLSVQNVSLDVLLGNV